MEIEKQLRKLYYDYIKEKSIFSDLILIVPKTPQSFSSFPTIVFKESSNTSYTGGNSLNRLEMVDRLNYQVEFYTQDVTINNKKYYSLDVINELKQLTFKFFNDIGFTRIMGSKGEYPDLTIDRYISIYQGKINNWNGQLN